MHDEHDRQSRSAIEFRARTLGGRWPVAWTLAWKLLPNARNRNDHMDWKWLLTRHDATRTDRVDTDERSRKPLWRKSPWVQIPLPPPRKCRSDDTGSSRRALGARSRVVRGTPA